MWNWFNCYLSGRHDYGMWCEPGAIFLRCIHCGRRSPGWAVDAKAAGSTPLPQLTVTTHARTRMPKVIPFDRQAAS
jgi:hypothetical protein